jgi:ZIP family zinc transporter
MAFGSGVLIGALTFGLMEDAFRLGGLDASLIGFFFGGVIFILGDYLIITLGGRSHKHHYAHQSRQPSSTSAITLGAILDGIPESIALGASLITGKSLGLFLAGAIFLSNFPEGASSVPGMMAKKHPKNKIIYLWIIVTFISALACLFGFTILDHASGNTLGLIQSMAAGAILAMIATTMMPEAYEEGGVFVALATIFGFMAAFILSKI